VRFTLKTIEQVKQQFTDSGVPISAWARKNGFSPALVHQILAGKVKCTRGESHRIAVLLELKQGSKGWYDDLPSIEDNSNDLDSAEKRKSA
jgi:gp16 family phage-associated protein